MASHGDDGAPTKPAETEAAEKASTRLHPARERVLKLRDVEGAHVHYALQASNWNKRQAARALGISRDTLYRKIKEHGLDSGHGDGVAGRRPRRPR